MTRAAQIRIFLALYAFSLGYGDAQDGLVVFPVLKKVKFIEGARVVDGVRADAKVLKQIGRGETANVLARRDENGHSFFMSDWSYQRWKSGAGDPNWMKSLGAVEVIDTTTLIDKALESRSGLLAPGKAEVIHTERGVSLFTGEPEEQRVWREDVRIKAEVRWPTVFSDFDLSLPVAVKSFKREAEHWEAVFTAFPNFNSSFARVGLEWQDGSALISMPTVREFSVTAEMKGDQIQQILKPGLVFRGMFHEGSLVKLEIGENPLSEIPKGKLSPPHFKRAPLLTFRFNTKTLNGGDVMIQIAPDKVDGQDYLVYDHVSRLGPPFVAADYQELGEDDERKQSWWSVEINSKLDIYVVTPLFHEKGGAPMLELESLKLAPEYKDLLTALNEFDRQNPEPLPAPAGDWFSIMETELGEVPASQRLPETGW